MGDKITRPNADLAQDARQPDPVGHSRGQLHEAVRRTQGLDNQMALLSPLSRRRRSTKKKLKSHKFLTTDERKVLEVQMTILIPIVFGQFGRAVDHVRDELKRAAAVNSNILGFIADLTLGRLIPRLSSRLANEGKVIALLPESRGQEAFKAFKMFSSRELTNLLSGSKEFFRSQASAANPKVMTASKYVESLAQAVKLALLALGGSLHRRSDQALVSVFATYVELSFQDFVVPLRKKALEFNKFIKPIGQSDGSSGRHGARRYVARVGGTGRLLQVSRSFSVAYGARETNVKYRFIKWIPFDWQAAAKAQAEAKGVFLDELSPTWVKNYQPPKGGRYEKFEPEKSGKKSEVPLLDKTPQGRT